MSARDQYEQVYDGEWWTVDLRGVNYDKCCRCGLVHRVRYKVVKSLSGRTQVIQQVHVSQRKMRRIRK